jgi:predicted NBD/HSP70 family sugar kinase
MNARAVLELIHREGPMARADIAAGTGLSKPTVTQALTTLQAAGVVDETGYSHGRPGPAATLYRVRPASGLSVGVDIGHDRVHAAIADITGEIQARTHARTRRRLDSLVAQVREMAADLAAQMNVSVAALVHVVVGVPAVVHPDGERLSLGDSLPSDGMGFPLAIRRALGVPVTLENDTNLAVLGERAAGHGRDVNDFVIFSIGTGLGVGIVLGGKLYRGVSGAAGEVGYLPGDDPGVAPTPPHDRAMIKDTLSGPTVVDEAISRGMPHGITAPEVFDLARADDRRALAVVDTISRRIAYVICCVTAVLDPELVVLAGGVGLNQDLLLEPVTRHVQAMSPFTPRIEVSKGGKEAALLGAVSLASELARDAVFSAASVSSSRT